MFLGTSFLPVEARSLSSSFSFSIHSLHLSSEVRKARILLSLFPSREPRGSSDPTFSKVSGVPFSTFPPPADGRLFFFFI